MDVCANGHVLTHSGTKCGKAGAKISMKAGATEVQFKLHDNGAMVLGSTAGNAVCLDATLCSTSGDGHAVASAAASQSRRLSEIDTWKADMQASHDSMASNLDAVIARLDALEAK